VAGKDLGAAKLIDDGGLSTRRACSKCPILDRKPKQTSASFTTLMHSLSGIKPSNRERISLLDRELTCLVRNDHFHTMYFLQPRNAECKAPKTEIRLQRYRSGLPNKPFVNLFSDRLTCSIDKYKLQKYTSLACLACGTLFCSNHRICRLPSSATCYNWANYWIFSVLNNHSHHSVCLFIWLSVLPSF
jgi:hypothetical protein